jgi:hypothetical protein
MAILFNSGRFKATDLANEPIPGAFLGFFSTGTSTPQPIYSDPALTIALTNPTQADGNGLFPEIWLDESLNPYKVVFSSPDVNNPAIPGAVVWTIGQYTALGGQQIPALINPITAAETAASVVPTDFTHPFGDLRRYGAIGDGLIDDTTAWKTAIKLGYATVPAGLSFLITSPAILTGQVTIRGAGKTSKLLCDSTILTVTNGTGSTIDNVWLENVTAPWIITRNPSNFAASVSGTLQQSNTVLGYQPTSNDVDIWSSLTGAQQSQNVGPSIVFTGAASGICVSRIYGRFVRISILDATNSVVEDCDFRGGKGTFAAILFDNCTNNIQQGQNNQAINNRVGYASQCGVSFFSNVDLTIRGNTCYNCGQSGTQTAQAGGVAFTASVGGASSGTLNAGWTSPTGTWTFAFSNGETRTVLISSAGQTAVSWTGALSAGTVVNSAYWGIAGFPASLMDPRCGRALIEDNRCYNNYYDGLDCDSVFGTTNDATQTHHQIHNNYSFRNNGTGMNIDGQFNSVVGNHIFSNGRYGIWGICSYNDIVGNSLYDNNQSRNAGLSEILAVGAGANNKIADNYIYGSSTQNCPGIAVTQGSINYINDNVVVGPSSNFFGNLGTVTAVVDGNVDATTGPQSPQSFCIQLVNNSGTLQHVFYGDASASGTGLFGKVSGASSGGFTNSPTGADASTAFAAGAKIGSANTNTLIFNTGAQPVNNALMNASLVFNNTTTAVTVAPVFQSINVNGVTQYRLTLQFFNATTGAAFALTTANIASGKGLYVQFSGKLA